MNDEQWRAGPTVADLPPDMRPAILQRLEGIPQVSRRAMEAALVRDVAQERSRLIKRGGAPDVGPLAILDPNAPGSASYAERHRKTCTEVMPGVMREDNGG
ncbi:hypothetical protein NT2_05_00890 [Caenibius tardaugens NBRC 16725]|uniref:Uncharacterized protein n=1 Tax=Caenibius tardaugens NBRC 16725 TaxID=1219035 RepID=U3A336_9SPHN|nr:hypothetical protein [Caenibius tardaugens]AZI36527.1 hypothetical protein EGO55_11655 [Caenibius tardaugens NBRC 16725]GAD49168.1 hypothetical protein NT2_05_00890 [Caenibius tardaugens NBRC 16725]